MELFMSVPFQKQYKMNDCFSVKLSMFFGVFWRTVEKTLAGGVLSFFNYMDNNILFKQ